MKHALLCLLLSVPVSAETPAPAVTVPPATPDTALIRPGDAEKALPEGEARIRAGIILLEQLHSLMAGIKDRDSADAAVAPIMRLIGEFQAWGQGFSALPPLDDETRMLYERRYLRTINALNANIRAQGERIASAHFYGSTRLPAALASLVTSVQ